MLGIVYQIHVRFIYFNLGEAVNNALYENRKQIFGVIKPIAEKTVSDLLLDLINKIVINFSYDEVFPE